MPIKVGNEKRWVCKCGLSSRHLSLMILTKWQRMRRQTKYMILSIRYSNWESIDFLVHFLTIDHTLWKDFNIVVKWIYMIKCSRCAADSVEPYSCQHTNEMKLCSECYQEIHWLLTWVFSKSQVIGT